MFWGTAQLFGQWNYRLNDQLTLNAGLHYLLLTLNGSDALEPRGGLRWAFRPNQSVSVGYGLHSHIQNPATYFVVTGQPNSTRTSPNRNLGFTRSHQVVLAYDYSFTNVPDGSGAALRPLRLKAETYYQSLFDIPVSATERTAYAITNTLSGQASEALRNGGKGRNYGLELTLEQFMYRNAYFLWSSSVYRSEYAGSDGIWRSTRWDGRFATSLLAGKEFTFGTLAGKNRVLGLNIKLTYYVATATRPSTWQPQDSVRKPFTSQTAPSPKNSPTISAPMFGLAGNKIGPTPPAPSRSICKMRPTARMCLAVITMQPPALPARPTKPA